MGKHKLIEYRINSAENSQPPVVEQLIRNKPRDLDPQSSKANREPAQGPGATAARLLLGVLIC
jgi:hypothetical protein